jgi:GTP cyclohydrolase IA
MKKNVKKLKTMQNSGPTKNQIDKILSKVIPTPMVKNNLSAHEKIEHIAKSFTDIMTTLGLDLTDDSLADTPNRVAKMYVNEIFSGLYEENFPKITVLENKMQYDQMVVVQDIKIVSCCEHHFQTIEGYATIAYIPSNYVIGLSKLSRVARFFAKRPQVQERMTKQIADCLQRILKTDNIAVHINAKHFCMIARGVEESKAATITSDLRGDFKKRIETRKEFLLHCRHNLR